MVRRFSFAEVEHVLRAAGGGNAVLIGGQALNYWCQRYVDQATLIQQAMPFTSKDVDFQGEYTDVKLLLDALGVAQAERPTSMHDATNVAAMKLSIGDDELLVQYLVGPLGLRAKDVLSWAPTLQLGESQLKLMHPMHCMMSRIINAGPGLSRDDPDELRRVRASIVCARLWLEEQLSTGNTRAALRQEQDTFRFARSNPATSKVFRDHQIDSYDSIPEDVRMGQKYLSENRPRRLAQLRTRRANQMS